VAKLQNKVGKFGLIRDDKIRLSSQETNDFQDEVLAVLTQLGYKKPEAVNMIKKALDISSGIQSTEELLNVVYKQKKST